MILTPNILYSILRACAIDIRVQFGCVEKTHSNFGDIYGTIPTICIQKYFSHPFVILNISNEKFYFLEKALYIDTMIESAIPSFNIYEGFLELYRSDTTTVCIADYSYVDDVHQYMINNYVHWLSS